MWGHCLVANIKLLLSKMFFFTWVYCFQEYNSSHTVHELSFHYFSSQKRFKCGHDFMSTRRCSFMSLSALYQLTVHFQQAHLPDILPHQHSVYRQETSMLHKKSIFLSWAAISSAFLIHSLILNKNICKHRCWIFLLKIRVILLFWCIWSKSAEILWIQVLSEFFQCSNQLVWDTTWLVLIKVGPRIKGPFILCNSWCLSYHIYSNRCISFLWVSHRLYPQ